METTLSAPSLITSRPAPASRVSLFLSRHGHQLLALFPFLIVIWVVARYTVDVPYLDEWDFVPMLDKMYRGDLVFHDLWNQFSEHRAPFPLLILLGLARLTHWNTPYNSVVCIVLAVGICLALTSQIRLTAKALGLRQLRWAVPACSLVVFSISQFENWLWGWQLALLLSVLSALGAILLLANPPFRWSRFVGSLLLGFLASFSFGNGMLVWPIGFVLLCLIPPRGTVRRVAVCVWSLVAVLSLWLYLGDYHAPGDHPPLTVAFRKPLVFAAYVLKFLGSTCAQYGEGGILPDRVWGLILGLAGLAVLAWAGWTALQRLSANRAALAPYFALCAYSLGTALLTATARAGFGPGQAMCSRYCTFTGPLWFSIIVLLMLLSQCYSHAERPPAGEQAAAHPTPSDALPQTCGAGFPACRFTGLSGPVSQHLAPLHQVLKPKDSGRGPRIARWLLFAVIAFLALSSGFAIRSAKEHSGNLANGRRFLLALKTNPSPNSAHNELFVLHASPRLVFERYPFLLTNHLSTFRD